MKDIGHEQALEFAQYLADVGGQIALRYFRTPLEISRKADQGRVTAVDLEVESTLRRLIRERFPNHGIIGEEYGRLPARDYSWVIDPIETAPGVLPWQIPSSAFLLVCSFSMSPLLD
jgi:fructose-1,6-bisphosphatase/inositol monophosphatase family enzyme